MDPQRKEANEDNLNTQTMEQEVQPESCTSEPTQLDSLLQNIINPDTQSQLLDKPKSLASSKRPKNKRSTAESKSNIKPSYKPPVTNGNSMGIDSDSAPVKNMTPKERKRHGDNSTKNKYPSPAKVPKHIKEPDSNQYPITGLRR